MPHIANEALSTPITMEELHIAVTQGKKLKAPGYDGIFHEFFQLAWETTKVDLLDVMKQMFIDGSILDT
jgi:DNA topoisomerase IB